MNQPTHRERAEVYLARAAAWLDAIPGDDQDHATVAATLGTGHAVLAHLDALALPEPGAGEAILAAARKLTDEFALVQDHDHGEATIGGGDQLQDMIPGADVGRVAPETGAPVSLDAENGRSQIRADLAAVVSPAIRGFIDAEIEPAPEGVGTALTLVSVGLLTDVVAEALLEDGWRPGVEQLTREDRRGLAAVYGYELGEDEARRRLIEEGWRPPLPDFEGGEAELAAVLAHVLRDFTNDLPVVDCQRIAADAARAAWNAPLPEPPRVFFPGDTVPAGMWVSYETPNGLAAALGTGDWIGMVREVVELPFPTLDEWQAVVDRARAERAGHDRPLVSEEDYIPCRVNDETCVGQVTADRLCDTHRPHAERDQSTSDTSGQETTRG
ncbi:hypothetical protein ACIBCH_20780 [Amycolatopsis thailandensis]|uniref:hypothetical protein n=1 Tax=Amycolatopsis thailandensis TaxID=589330 RepID=UPI0037A437DB